MMSGSFSKSFSKTSAAPQAEAPAQTARWRAQRSGSGGLYVVLKQYTVFYNVDIVENILNLGVTREHLDVLPYQALRHVVSYQIMHYTTLYAPACCQWQKEVCAPLRALPEAQVHFARIQHCPSAE